MVCQNKVGKYTPLVYKISQGPISDLTRYDSYLYMHVFEYIFSMAEVAV